MTYSFNSENIFISGTMICDMSDHFTIFHLRFHSERESKYFYSQFSETLFNDELSCIQWESIMRNSSYNPHKDFPHFLTN